MTASVFFYVFADEAGCFTFKKVQGASRYFVLCTLTTHDCALANDLLNIRRDLAIAGDAERDKLHATSDLQATRDRVFEVLAKHDFRIDATLLEKSKAQPQTRADDPTFYRYAWFYHFQYVGPLLLNQADKLLITTAALGQKKARAEVVGAFVYAIRLPFSLDGPSAIVGCPKQGESAVAGNLARNTICWRTLFTPSLKASPAWLERSLRKLRPSST